MNNCLGNKIASSEYNHRLPKNTRVVLIIIRKLCNTSNFKKKYYIQYSKDIVFIV